MKLTVNTLKLQTMLNKALKGATNNKLLPMTSLICLNVKDGVLTLVTTDDTNYLYVRDDVEGAEDFYAVVDTDKFSKLISKFTCENTTITVKDNGIKVVGNGTYMFELQIDSDGSQVAFPNPIGESGNFKEEWDEVATISVDTINTILSAIKPSVADKDVILCGYYFGDTVIGTDRTKMACLRDKIFEKPSLISQEVVNLLSLMTEDVKVYGKDNTLIFTTENIALYSISMPDVEDYPSDRIMEKLNDENGFNSMVKVPKTDLMKLLERIALFVGDFDNKAINLVFTMNGMQISNKVSSGVETVEYIEGKNIKDFACLVNIDILYTQIKAQISDVVEIWYGNPSAIKLIDDNVVMLTALMYNA